MLKCFSEHTTIFARRSVLVLAASFLLFSNPAHAASPPPDECDVSSAGLGYPLCNLPSFIPSTITSASKLAPVPNTGSTVIIDAARADPPAAITPIDQYDICRYVNVTAGQPSIFIPFRTSPEWMDFLNHPPSSVTLGLCSRPTSQLIAPGADCLPTPASANYSLPYEPTGTTVNMTNIAFSCKDAVVGDWTQTATATWTGLNSDTHSSVGNGPDWVHSPITYSSAPTVVCPANQSVQWTVTNTATNGGSSSSTGTTSTCTATVTNAVDAPDTVRVTSGNGNNGNAVFQCECTAANGCATSTSVAGNVKTTAGTFTVQPGATCGPPASCSGTVTWTVGSTTCSGTAKTTNSGAGITVSSTNGNTGNASFNCTNGSFGSALPGDTCTAGCSGTVTWTVGTTSCTGTASSTPNGGISLPVTADAPNTGTATFNCNNGSFGTPNSGDTCNPPLSDCSGSVSWKVGDTTCTGTAGDTKSGKDSSPVSANAPNTGSATFICTNGTFGPPDAGDTCEGPNANGACGSASGVAASAAPSGNLCATGTASSVSGPVYFQWLWTCSGQSGGSPTNCSAPQISAGVCGSANGSSLASAPSGSALCNIGNASSVSGSGPWSWTCSGTNGGVMASCSASSSGSTSPTGSGPTGPTGSGPTGPTGSGPTGPTGSGGQCGTANNVASANAPAANLCTDGSSPTVILNTASSQWSWNCGANSCQAPVEAAQVSVGNVTCGGHPCMGGNVECYTNAACNHPDQNTGPSNRLMVAFGTIPAGANTLGAAGGCYNASNEDHTAPWSVYASAVGGSAGTDYEEDLSVGCPTAQYVCKYYGYEYLVEYQTWTDDNIAGSGSSGMYKCDPSSMSCSSTQGGGEGHITTAWCAHVPNPAPPQ